ncbi:MAG: DUF362 domain-containing protein [Oceanipulchritudo sp.]
MHTRVLCNRRHFLKAGLIGTVTGLLGRNPVSAESPSAPLSPVALTSGADRRENLLRALELVKREILRAAHGKRILLKPNMVNYDGDWGANAELSSSHFEQLEIVADWFRHLGFRDMVVAESTPNGMTLEGFETLGYTNLDRKLPLVFKDLNQEGYKLLNINGTYPDVRISRLILDDSYFRVSLAKLKTHNNVALTFSGKNIFMCSPIIDVKNFSKQGGRSDKSRMHGSTNQHLHDNLFLLAHNGIRPDLAVIDGFEGMEGEGPCWGDPVPSHLAVVSTDWLACDRVCCELVQVEKQLQSIGLTPELPAYLRYCAQAGMGAFSLEQIELRGEPLDGLCRQYKLHDDVAGMIGMDPDAPIYRTGPAEVSSDQGKVAPPLRM